MKPVENWEPFMTRREAVAFARELSDKGVRQTDIAQKLWDAGYRNAKTDKPITASSVCIMLKAKRRKRSPAPAQRKESVSVAKKARSGPHVDAIKSILKLKGMAADERIALALLVLE